MKGFYVVEAPGVIPTLTAILLSLKASGGARARFCALLPGTEAPSSWKRSAAFSAEQCWPLVGTMRLSLLEAKAQPDISGPSTNNPLALSSQGSGTLIQSLEGK